MDSVDWGVCDAITEKVEVPESNSAERAEGLGQGQRDREGAASQGRRIFGDGRSELEDDKEGEAGTRTWRRRRE